MAGFALPGNLFRAGARSRRMGFVSLIMLLVAVLVAGFLVFVPHLQKATAAGTVDLKAQLEAPTSMSVYQDFEIIATISNIGVDTANSAEFVAQFDSLVTNLAVTCQSATGGAQCPATFNVDQNTKRVTGTVPVLPQHGEVKLKFTGRFGNGSSADTSLTVTAAAGDTDIDPASNYVVQQTALDDTKPVANIYVSKTQDKSSVSHGGTITYTLTLENQGSDDVKGLRLLDSLYFGSDISWSMFCAAGTTINCPDWVANAGTSGTRINVSPYKNIFHESIDLPAGKRLVLTVPVVFYKDSCGSVNILNRLQVDIPSGYEIPSWISSGSFLIVNADARFNGVPCPPKPVANIYVSKTQDKRSVSHGGTITYTLTLENQGSDDVKGLRLLDSLYFGSDISWSMFCAAGTTINCPDWVANAGTSGTRINVSPYKNIFHESIDLPAGERLVLTVPVVFYKDSCGSVNILNRLQVDIPSGYEIPSWISSGSFLIVNADARFNEPIDVSTSTGVSSASPNAGGPLNVTSTVTGSCGDARNTEFKVKLPKDGFVATSSTQTPTCTVSHVSGGAIPAGVACPAVWVYDRVNHELRATFPRVPKDVSFTIVTSGRAGVVPPTTASYRVSSLAPTPGDHIPTVNALNQSDATFGLVNSKTQASVKVTITGFTQNKAPHNIVFNGSMVCSQGTFPVTVTVPQNSNVGSVLVTQDLWKNDDCTVTMQTPAGNPQGYVWKPWTQGPAITKTNINNPVLFEFVIPVTATGIVPPALPLTGGVASDSFYLGGAGVLLAGLLGVAVIVLRRVRTPFKHG